MATVLMTWEIGQGFGHVLSLLPAARHLRSQGHEVVFALKDLRRAGPTLLAEGFRVLQGPAHPDAMLQPEERQPETMAEVLALFGFADAAVMSCYLQAWRSLMQLVGAELVVASYAPCSLVAARSLGLPTALVGLPFEIPPRHSPSISFRPGLRTPPEQLLRSDQRVIDAVQAAVQPWGLPLTSVADVFAADLRVLLSFPELDTYAEHRQADHDLLHGGGMYTSDVGAAPRWPDRKGPRLFGYLHRTRPNFRPLLDELRQMPVAVCLSVPDLPAHEVAALEADNLSIVPQAVRMDEALGQCDAVLAQAGHGTLCASLFGGRPLVLLPMDMETHQLAQCAVRLGVALVPRLQMPGALAATCQEVLSNPFYRANVERFRDKYRDHDPVSRGTWLAHRIARLLPLPA